MSRSPVRVSRVFITSSRTRAVLSKASCELPGRFGRFRAQQPFFDNRRQVAVLQRDGVKTRLPPVQDIGKPELLGAGRCSPTSSRRSRWRAMKLTMGMGRSARHGLDQFGQFLAFAIDEGQISRVAGQPQDQLVEKQHHRVIAQRLRVPAT